MPLTPSPILVGDELYTISNQGVVSCLEAKTGEPLSSSKSPISFGSASQSNEFLDRQMGDDGDPLCLELRDVLLGPRSE